MEIRLYCVSVYNSIFKYGPCLYRSWTNEVAAVAVAAAAAAAAAAFWIQHKAQTPLSVRLSRDSRPSL